MPRDLSAVLDDPSKDVVIYDSECPFCTNYVRLVRLRETVEDVRVISARTAGVAAWAARHGFDLEQGMLARIDGTPHHGAEAMWVISTLTSSSRFSRMIRPLLSCLACVRMIYPVLRSSRRLALAALGRSRLR
jgi:predicted DCC family thiol-disulfide oxidoreductase YuxK